MPEPRSALGCLMRMEERVVLDAAAVAAVADLDAAGAEAGNAAEPADASQQASDAPQPADDALAPADALQPDAADSPADAPAPADPTDTDAADPTDPAGAAEQTLARGGDDADADLLAHATDVAIAAPAGPEASPRLLLIDAGLAGSEDLAAAVGDQALRVTYDPHTDTPEAVFQRIDDALDGRAAASIGLAAHGGAGRLSALDGEHITAESLRTDAAQRAFLAGLGERIDAGGRLDLLTCDLAANADGEALVAEIEALTGLEVAASDDATGHAAPDAPEADWLLEVGGIDAAGTYFDAAALAGFDGVLALPTVSDVGGTVTFTEGGDPVLLDGAVAVTGDTFADGYVLIDLADGGPGDSLTLASDGDVNAEGAISLTGDSVYLGNGSGREKIGEIDGTYDGQGGQDLKILLSTPMTNSGFETGNTSGWTVDTSFPGLPGDSGSGINQHADVLHDAGQASEGEHYLRLRISGSTDGFGTAHGPEITSDYFEASTGDTIALDWWAVDSGDDYDVYGYLIDDNTGTTTEIFYERGDNTGGWQTETITLDATSDQFKFVFLCGSYDATGGTVIGSTMYIDNVRVFSAGTDAAVAESLIEHVTFSNDSDDPATGDRTYTVTVCDYAGETATSGSGTIQVEGVNDPPSMTTNAGATVTEGQTVTIGTGSLLAEDVDDDPAGLTYTVTSAVAHGTLRRDGTELGVGDTFTQADVDADLVTYANVDDESVSDAFGFSLADGGEDGAAAETGTFQLGIRQAPVAGDDAGSVGEDATADAAGTVTITDPNGDATASVHAVEGSTGNVGSAVAGAYGELTVAADGSWSYALDNASAAVQELREGQTVTDSFAVTVRDATGLEDTATVTLSVAGANDAPVIDDAVPGGVAEDGATAASGALTSDDADTGDTHTFGVDDGAGGYGTLTVEADGSWSYSLDNASAAVQQLRGGQTVADMFTVRVTDAGGLDDTATVTVNVTGANDAPILDDQTVATVTEDGTTSASGTLAYDGVDVGDTHTFDLSDGDGSYGTLTVDADGDWSYTLDNASAAVQELRGGQTVTDTFTVGVTDGGGLDDTGTVTVTVTGANDAPILDDQTVATVTEDGTTSASGTLAYDGVDVGDTHTFDLSDGDGSYGTLTVDADGDWSYTLDNASTAVQELRGGQTVTDTFTVGVTDGGGLDDTGTVTVTVTGENDAPTAASETLEVHEVSPQEAAGAVTVEDVDTESTFRVTRIDLGEDSADVPADGQGELAGTYGTLIVDADGTYRYELAAGSQAVEFLITGQTVSETFTLAVADGLGGTDTTDVTVSIDGYTPPQPDKLDPPTPVAPEGSGDGDAPGADSGPAALPEPPAGDNGADAAPPEELLTTLDDFMAGGGRTASGYFAGVAADSVPPTATFVHELSSPDEIDTTDSLYVVYGEMAWNARGEGLVEAIGEEVHGAENAREAIDRVRARLIEANEGAPEAVIDALMQRVVEQLRERAADAAGNEADSPAGNANAGEPPAPGDDAEDAGGSRADSDAPAGAGLLGLIRRLLARDAA